VVDSTLSINYEQTVNFSELHMQRWTKRVKHSWKFSHDRRFPIESTSAVLLKYELCTLRIFKRERNRRKYGSNLIQVTITRKTIHIVQNQNIFFVHIFG
jgi:hypothetical protein